PYLSLESSTALKGEEKWKLLSLLTVIGRELWHVRKPLKASSASPSAQSSIFRGMFSEDTSFNFDTYSAWILQSLEGVFDIGQTVRGNEHDVGTTVLRKLFIEPGQLSGETALQLLRLLMVLEEQRPGVVCESFDRVVRIVQKKPVKRKTIYDRFNPKPDENINIKPTRRNPFIGLWEILRIIEYVNHVRSITLSGQTHATADTQSTSDNSSRYATEMSSELMDTSDLPEDVKDQTAREQFTIVRTISSSAMTSMKAVSSCQDITTEIALPTTIDWEASQDMQGDRKDGFFRTDAGGHSSSTIYDGALCRRRLAYGGFSGVICEGLLVLLSLCKIPLILHSAYCGCVIKYLRSVFNTFMRKQRELHSDERIQQYLDDPDGKHEKPMIRSLQHPLRLVLDATRILPENYARRIKKECIRIVEKAANSVILVPPTHTTPTHIRLCEAAVNELCNCVNLLQSNGCIVSNMGCLPLSHRGACIVVTHRMLRASKQCVDILMKIHDDIIKAEEERKLRCMALDSDGSKHSRLPLLRPMPAPVTKHHHYFVTELTRLKSNPLYIVPLSGLSLILRYIVTNIQTSSLLPSHTKSFSVLSSLPSNSMQLRLMSVIAGTVASLSDTHTHTGFALPSAPITSIFIPSKQTQLTPLLESLRESAWLWCGIADACYAGGGLEATQVPKIRMRKMRYALEFPNPPASLIPLCLSVLSCAPYKAQTKPIYASSCVYALGILAALVSGGAASIHLFSAYSRVHVLAKRKGKKSPSDSSEMKGIGMNTRNSCSRDDIGFGDLPQTIPSPLDSVFSRAFCTCVAFLRRCGVCARVYSTALELERLEKKVRSLEGLFPAWKISVSSGDVRLCDALCMVQGLEGSD
ncbi:hypothetical protein ADUPG1_005936, partial [Aduncisulcus paluster]